jgi:hypothetical protein
MSPEFRVALVRGILHALLAGGLAFLGVWSQTDDLKTLSIAFATPALTVLGTRFLGEGWRDTVLARRPGTAQHAARIADEGQAR